MPRNTSSRDEREPRASNYLRGVILVKRLARARRGIERKRSSSMVTDDGGGGGFAARRRLEQRGGEKMKKMKNLSTMIQAARNP